MAARRRAIDLMRREGAATARRPARCSCSTSPATTLRTVVRDDLLRLVFTCCHPSLAQDTQVALAPAHPLRAAHRRGRPRPAGARGDHGQAADPGPAEDRSAPHPLPGSGGPRAAGSAARRRRHRLPDVQRGLRGPSARPDTGPPGRRGHPAGPAAARADARRAAGARACWPCMLLQDSAPGHPPRRRRRARCCWPTRTDPAGAGGHRRGRGPGRRGAAAQPGPARSLRRAGRHRGLPRARGQLPRTPTGPPWSPGTTCC